MPSPSVLFPPDAARPDEDQAAEPPFFGDLNLDQVVDALLAGRKTYRLRPFFYHPLHDAAAVRYRQAVAQDLENDALREHVHTFATRMRQVNRYLRMLNDLEYPYHIAGWFLEAVLRYTEAVQALADALAEADLHAAAFLALRDYLADYVHAAAFTALRDEAQAVRAELDAIRYCIHIMGDTVRVRRCEDEPDHAAEVERTFAKFRRGAVKDYRTPVYVRSGMNHIEAQILDCVVKLYPEPFAHLDAFRARHPDFLDPVVTAFDREVQFYLAYLEFIAPLREAGLPFCTPEIITDKAIAAQATFDLALAHKLVSEGRPVVTNDFALHGKERIFVVTGPNQGGKTTFARTVGQLHYLAALGLPVPGREARLVLPDRIFTHFERAEEVTNLRGKLEDELIRLRETFEQATPQSLIILNEVFASTTFQDALFLGRQVMEKLLALDALGVFVTFLAELSTLGPQVVSMVSTVDPENPAERTYKIVRRRADGLAYALALAEKHHLTHDQLVARVRP